MGGGLLESVEMYCLETEAWVTAVSALPSPRGDFALATVATAALLPNTLAQLR